jgi:hypothetical protein
MEWSPGSVSGNLTRILGAGLVYFALVFSTGFMQGSVRVPLLEPRLGKFFATLLEAPLMIMAIVVAAKSVTAWFELTGRKAALLFVGIWAVSLAAAADLCVGLFLRVMSFGEQVLLLLTPAGLTNLILLAVCATMPLFADLWRSRV